MNKTLVMGLALFTGLLGGLLSRYIAPPTASAQTPAPVAKDVRAQSFTLVDPADHTIGVFTAEPAVHGANPSLGGWRVVLRDSRGRELWSAGGTGIRPASER